MLGVVKQVAQATLFHHPARVHHRDPVRDVRDHAHVVGDQDDGRAEVIPELLDQREDLRLDGHVQRGRGLIGDQQVGVAGKRHRDHHALAHPAGELVRIVVHPLRGVRYPHGLEQLDGPGARGLPR